LFFVLRESRFLRLRSLFCDRDRESLRLQLGIPVYVSAVLVTSYRPCDMSKATTNINFRKLEVDIDDINEDAYREDDDTDQAFGADEGEVTGFLNQNRLLDALKAALKNPPLKSKNEAAKRKSVSLVLRVLMTIKTADIEKTIGALSRDESDVLFKYIYKGFEYPQENSSACLLTWHEKMFAVGGLGAIVRVLTDRKKL